VYFVQIWVFMKVVGVFVRFCCAASGTDRIAS
jgi:hypothetical protein